MGQVSNTFMSRELELISIVEITPSVNLELLDLVVLHRQVGSREGLFGVDPSVSVPVTSVCKEPSENEDENENNAED